MKNNYSNKKQITVGLIGDYDQTITAHQAIPVALKLISEQLQINIEHQWIPTETILSNSRVDSFDALWCVPGSPYRDMDGALLAIQYARENNVPFLGTCGGFQHAVIEYARNVLGWKDAEHAETSPDATRIVISPLACALVEKSSTVNLVPGTKIAEAYGRNKAEEGYRCRYGLNPEFEQSLISGNLRVSARDDTNEVRAVELANQHPFYVATLFQPERHALNGHIPALAFSFIKATFLSRDND